MLRWLLLASMVGCVEQVRRPAPAGDGAATVGGASGGSSVVSTPGAPPPGASSQGSAAAADDECADKITACLALQGLLRDYCFMCARCSDVTEPELDARCRYVPERASGRF